MEDMQDREILNEFVAESREHLADIESELLEMEQAGEDADDALINKVFRAIHTVKGASGFFGLKKISSLSHIMENLLMKIRDKEMAISSEAIDALLNGADLLKTMIDDVDNSEAFETDEAITSLEAILSGGGEPAGAEGTEEGASAEKPEETEKPAIPDEVLKAAGKGAQTLYRFVMSSESIATAFEKEKEGQTLKDVLSQTGEVPYGTPDPANITREDSAYPDKVEIYFSTILEADVIAMTLGVPQDGIEKVQIPHSDDISEEKKPDKKEKTKKTVSEKPPAKPDGKSTETSSAKKRTGAKTSQQETIRVSVSLLTRLMDLAGELVLGRNQLLQTVGDKELPLLHTLSQRVTELQENVMQTRMQPVGNIFNKFPRIVRDMSKKVSKKIKLEIEGGEVELDRSIIEVIGDPLTHLIRNSVDHGIETPEERIKAGKEEEGTIWLRAYQEGGQVNIEIQDDGKGIDPVKIREKALEKGVIDEEEAFVMSNRELVNLIFMPGFSTVEKVSDISGRGVGMDVVKTNFEKFGGVIETNSEVGKGTTITVRLPLTLAIIPSIIIMVQGHRFAVPQINLEEIVRVKGETDKIRIERIKGNEVLRLRGHLLPLVRLADVLKIPRVAVNPETKEALIDKRKNIADRRSNGEPVSEEIQEQRKGEERRKNVETLNILVLKVGGSHYGLIVDKVMDTEEIVVKPLSKFIKGVGAFSGNTIMGDGKVALILDIQGIARLANLKFNDIEEISKADEASLARRELLEKQYILLFTVHEKEVFVLPMAMVARLEKIFARDIETVGDKEFVQLRGSSLPLIRLNKYLPINPPENNPDSYFVIVPKMVRHPMGIMVTKVLDVLETVVDLDTEAVHEEGFLGTAIINERTTIMLDLYKLFEMVDPEQKAAVVAADNLDKVARILVAEDTPFFMKLTTGYLKSAGYEVVGVEDGAKALEILKKEPVDLLISDIEMPVMDGFELIEKIRKDPELSDLPAMALTALSSEDYRARGLSLGFDAYEVKIDKERVLTTVYELLMKKRNATAA